MKMRETKLYYKIKNNFYSNLIKNNINIESLS